jgi:hypothetical protein
MDPVPSTPVSPPPPPAANHLASQHSAAPVPTTRQAVTGVVPPDVGEAMIREIRPTVLAGGGAIPGLARTFMKTIVLAPVGWLLLGPLFAKKLLPFISRRYTLTNRRLMIQHGLKPSPVHRRRPPCRFQPGLVLPFRDARGVVRRQGRADATRRSRAGRLSAGDP